MISGLQDELHGLDHEIERLRRRMWAIEHGLEVVADPEGELRALRQEFDAAGRRFTQVYRAWSRQHAAE